MEQIRGLFRDLIGASQGVFIGEEHGDLAHTDLVKQLSPDFNDLGIDTFYFELVPASENWRLEQWQKDGDFSAMEEWLASQDMTYADGMWDEYKALMNFLNDRGVRIVGIDNRDGDRGFKTNKFWADVIRKDQEANPGKYIAYGGRAHTRTDDCQFDETIQEQLSIPALFLMTAKGQGIRRRRDFEEVFVVKLDKHENQPDIYRG